MLLRVTAYCWIRDGTQRERERATDTNGYADLSGKKAVLKSNRKFITVCITFMALLWKHESPCILSEDIQFTVSSW